MLLKCQLEPFLKECQAKVLECTEVKKGKKKQYEITLDDTVLFAEGGGQPCDFGTFSSHSSGRLQVLDVQRKNGVAVHTTPKPLTVGDEIRVELDWKRRYDHMQQHTGLAISHVELNSPKLEEATKSELENIINRHIQSGLPVVTHVYASKEDPKLSTAHTRGLPAGHTGPIRVVEIKGVDENMCCGTHLTTLSQVQMVKLLHTESKRGNTLLYFVCGDRVLNTLQASLDVQQKLNNLLSAPPEQFGTLVEKVLSDSRAHRKSVERLSEELAVVHADQLKRSSEMVLYAHRDTPNQEYSLTVQRELRDIYEDSKLFLLTMGERGSAQFVFRGPPAIVDKLGKEVASKLGGKGGGRDGKFQGKFSDLSLIPEALNFLKSNF